MKLIKLFVTFLCLKSSLAFFSLQVSKVQFESELISAINPITEAIDKLQDSLEELHKSIVAADKVPRAMLANDLTRVGVNYLFMEFSHILMVFFDDFERNVQDQSLTDPRVFGALADDVKRIVDYSVKYKLKEVSENIDKEFNSKLEQSLTLMIDTFITLSQSISALAGNLETIYGSTHPLSAQEVQNKLDQLNIMSMKEQLTVVLNNCKLLTTEFNQLMLTVQAITKIAAATSSPLSSKIPGIVESAQNDFIENAQDASKSLKSMVGSSINDIRRSFESFNTKLLESLMDTVQGPIIPETIKAVDRYVVGTSAHLAKVNSTFVQLSSTYSDPNSRGGSFTVDVDLAANEFYRTIEELQIILINYLKKNTAQSRNCMDKFSGQVVLLISGVNGKFEKCIDEYDDLFTSYEQILETTLQNVKTDSMKMASNMSKCISDDIRVAIRYGAVICVEKVMANLEENLIKNSEFTDNAMKALERDFGNSEMVFRNCNKNIVLRFMTDELRLRDGLINC